MASNKRTFSIFCVLCCIILIQFIIIVIGFFSPPEIVIQEKQVPVEIEKEVIVTEVIEKEIVVEVEKEVIVEVEKEVIVEQEPTYVYNITSEEREMLARLLYQEANIESIECQMAVASVVINRWKSGIWGDTLEKVVHATGQFSPAKILYRTTPNETNYEAVDYVLQNGITIPGYVMYFRAHYGFSNVWNNYKEYKQIDDTFFGYFIKDKQ